MRARPRSTPCPGTRTAGERPTCSQRPRGCPGVARYSDRLSQLQEKLSQLRCEADDAVELLGSGGGAGLLPGGTGRAGGAAGYHLPAEKEVRLHGGGDAGLPGAQPPGAGPDPVRRRHHRPPEPEAGEGQGGGGEAGGVLSQARRRAAEALQTRVQEELRQLDMPKVRFQVEFAPKEGPGGWMRPAGTRCSSSCPPMWGKR